MVLTPPGRVSEMMMVMMGLEVGGREGRREGETWEGEGERERDGSVVGSVTM